MNIERLKNAKKEKKLTYEELSKSSGVPLSTIYDLFRGVTTAPRIDTMQAIEKALGLDNAYSDEEISAGSNPTIKKSITPIEHEMLLLFRDIGNKHGEQAQRALITVAEKML